MEGAAGRQGRQAGRRTRDTEELAAGTGQPGHRLNQHLGVRVLGLMEHLMDGASLNDPSVAIARAMREQLGLDLHAGKGLVDSFAIERAEKPSAN